MIARKERYYGKMRKLWEENLIWFEPPLVKKGNSTNFPAQPTDDHGSEGWKKSPQGFVRKMYPDLGENQRLMDFDPNEG